MLRLGPLANPAHWGWWALGGVLLMGGAAAVYYARQRAAPGHAVLGGVGHGTVVYQGQRVAARYILPGDSRGPHYAWAVLREGDPTDALFTSGGRTFPTPKAAYADMILATQFQPASA